MCLDKLTMMEAVQRIVPEVLWQPAQRTIFLVAATEEEESVACANDFEKTATEEEKITAYAVDRGETRVTSSAQSNMARHVM